MSNHNILPGKVEIPGQNKKTGASNLTAPVCGALGVTRTRDPLLRKQVLYPLSYEGISFLAYARLFYTIYFLWSRETRKKNTWISGQFSNIECPSGAFSSTPERA